MALPQDGQDANGLTKVTQIPAGKELMFIDPTTNEGGIITLEDLTKQILNGLTSQTFGLDSGTQTLPAAINYLYGKSSFISKEKGVDIQVANEYVYTGLSFTVPKNTLFIFTARADYNTSESVGISITGSDLNHNISTIVVNSEKYPTVLTHVLDRVSEDITYYIWAKYKSKGNNRIVIYGLQMK